MYTTVCNVLSPFFAGEAGEKMFENDTKIPTDAEKTALDSYLKSHFPRDRKKKLDMASLCTQFSYSMSTTDIIGYHSGPF